MRKTASASGSQATEKRVRTAVRELRLGLNDTQQQFAARINLAISTVVRYELTRAPSGKALTKLFELADRYRFREQAEVFRSALIEEFGLNLPGTLNKLADPGVIMMNPRRIYDRDLLVEGFDKHVASINNHGDIVDAIDVHFHTSSGETVIMPVAPPENQLPRKIRRLPPILAGSH
jgi:transcriptional regulator with XRE-family HTH domain